MLQWGRTLSSAESILLAEFLLADIYPLQWGRTLSSAESQHSYTRLRSQGEGFNGAALFQVRKEVHRLGRLL